MNGGYSFSFHSKRHEGCHTDKAVGTSECCHNAYLLPDGSAVQVVTYGRRHWGNLTISFFDESGNPCGAEAWGARQPVVASAENVPDFYSCSGLLIKLSSRGRRSYVTFNVHSSADRTKLRQCGICYGTDVGSLLGTTVRADGGSETGATSSDSMRDLSEHAIQTKRAEISAVGTFICHQGALYECF